MRRGSPERRRESSGASDPRLLYLLLLIVPLAVAGVSGHLVRVFEVSDLTFLEAGQMAHAALAIAAREGPDTALKTLEGTAGYEVALYRDGVRTRATDPGFGPDTLRQAQGLLPGPDVSELAIEVAGRSGSLAVGTNTAALAAASRPREPGSTYPGGLPAVGGVALVLLFMGVAILSRRPGTWTLRVVAMTGICVSVSWVLLIGAAAKVSGDAERASAREVGLATAIARELGADAPLEHLAAVTGLRVARLGPGKVAVTSWQQEQRPVDLQGLPRPPLGRTITGYLSTGEGKLRYGASRTPEGTVVFLAPAPELPPPRAALLLLLLGLAVTGAAVAFVVLARRPSDRA